MPIRDFKKDSNVADAANNLRTRHKRYLETIPLVMVEKMLRILQEYLNGHSLQEALERVKPEFEVGENEDLNVLAEDVLDRKKAVMEHTFSKTRLKPGDPGFEYDKRVDFPQPVEPSDWDEPDKGDDDEDFWD